MGAEPAPSPAPAQPRRTGASPAFAHCYGRRKPSRRMFRTHSRRSDFSALARALHATLLLAIDAGMSSRPDEVARLANLLDVVVVINHRALIGAHPEGGCIARRDGSFVDLPPLRLCRPRRRSLRASAAPRSADRAPPLPAARGAGSNMTRIQTIEPILASRTVAGALPYRGGAFPYRGGAFPYRGGTLPVPWGDPSRTVVEPSRTVGDPSRTVTEPSRPHAGRLTSRCGRSTGLSGSLKGRCGRLKGRK